MSIIEVNDLTKTYKTYHRGSSFKESLKSFIKRDTVIVNAVDNISFQIQDGDICGILGPNGAGKSTTIKMLCGALFPTSGSIRVMDYSPAKDRLEYVRMIGAVFGQKSQLIWDIPPIDSFQMNQAIYGIEDQLYKSRLEELAEAFDVQQIMYKPTRVLSLGERMKCEFIMAMLHEPKVVFLDEPTIGLDVIAKATIRDFIRKMNQRGTTFILTTHDLEDVEQLANKAIIINHGKKVYDDTIEKMRGVLGSKKIVELVLSKPLSINQLKDVMIIEEKSPMQLTIEVDTSQKSIGQFIHEISEQLQITDMSIKELPMDQIIRALYER